jgi:NADPH-dependent curcumin reductase CurA
VPVAVEPVPRTTRIVTLASRPDGRPTAANLGVDEQPVGEPGPGQVLVRNVYMSVDPAMRGRMEPTEKHYTTNFAVGGPLDGSAIGRVIASRADGFAAGDFVRHRLGWRDYALVDAAAATVVDPALAPLPYWLGVLGQTGFTAYTGLRRAGDIQPGDVVFVSAAAGAVGSTAGQLARLLGAARVIGSAGGTDKARLLVDELGFDAGIDYRAGLAEGLAAAAPDGIDLYFDNVGGDHLVAALYALRLHGRVALCGMISTMEDASAAPGVQHLIQAVLKRLTLRGFIVRDHEDLRPEFEKQVANWVRTGELVARQTVVDGLDNAVGAFIGLLAGANVGKMLVRLSPDSPDGA